MTPIRLTKADIEAGGHLDYSPLHHDFHRHEDGSTTVVERCWWEESPRLGEGGGIPQFPQKGSFSGLTTPDKQVGEIQ